MALILQESVVITLYNYDDYHLMISNFFPERHLRSAIPRAVPDNLRPLYGDLNSRELYQKGFSATVNNGI